MKGRHPDDLAFPLQSARTQGFTLGIPRNLTVSPDGERVVFLRSPAGEDPVNALWVFDVDTGLETCVFDPATWSETGELSAAEKARRERARERASGVVRYACDSGMTMATFTLGAQLLVVDLASGEARSVDAHGTPHDPRLDPAGKKVAYVSGPDLYVQDVDGPPHLLASESQIAWGLAEFVAAEEMGRDRGFGWSPDGSRIAACRVDESDVEVWWLSDPADPAAEPTPMRYPQAGTANADVTLHVIDVASGARTPVEWDREGFEYLARVSWSEGSPLTLLVQSRDQRRVRLLEAGDDGSTSVVWENDDPAWVELVRGSPERLSDGTPIATADLDGTRRVIVGGEPATPSTLHVRDIIGADEQVWFTASEDDPTQTHVWRLAPGTPPERVTQDPGLHAAAVGGATVVVKSWTEHAQHPVTVVRAPDGRETTLASHPEDPAVDPQPAYATLGERRLRAALLLPGGSEPESPLPVLLSPYGGPHHQEVVRWRGAYRPAQFFADRLGVAVLVIDGRGTPGRGSEWERAVHRDFTVTLQDQVDGLAAAAQLWPFLDTSRAAIRGWSFGGMLAALAVTTRPDVFHAAVAGAPVTDQRLYDTHYTERYLGDPDSDPESYIDSSPLSHAEDLARPLLLIHGLADDNVVAAHTLQMSAALFRAGIHHELVLLPNASHMGGTAELVSARYIAELDFLRRSLGR